MSWIAYKFTPRIPKQERFSTNSIGVSFRPSGYFRSGRHIRNILPAVFWGKEGDKSERTDTESTPCPAGRRSLQNHRERNDSLFLCPADTDLEDPIGNLVTFRTNSHGKPESYQVPATEHAFEPENRYILPRHASLVPLLRETKQYTRLNYVKFK